jgi:hypothetical protein
MMQRWLFHPSFQTSFFEALSTLAFKNGRFRPGILYPQTMGKTARFPFLFGAITGTISVGLISPSVLSGFPSLSTILPASEDLLAFSTIGRSSGDISM